MRKFPNWLPSFLVLITYGQQQVHGQTFEVRYGFRYDTVSVEAGETFSNSLWVENGSAKEMWLFGAGPEQTSKGLLNLPDSIHLFPFEKKSFPVKFFADRHTIKRNFQEFPVKFVAAPENVTVQRRAVFRVQIEGTRGITIDTRESELYFGPGINQAKLTVQCYNHGLIASAIHLNLVNIQNGLKITGIEDTLQLDPGGQRSVELTISYPVNKRIASDFSVTIVASDASGEQLATKMIRIVNIASIKRLEPVWRTGSQSKSNLIALRYLTMSNTMSAWQLQGSGIHQLAGNRNLGYRVNTDYLGSLEGKTVHIYDSYIDFQSAKWGIRAGSIYDAFDFNINGTGIKASLKTGSGGSLNVYGLNNNYLIYTSPNSFFKYLGQTVAVAYKENRTPEKSKLFNIIGNTNIYTRVNTLLTSGSVSMPLSRKINIGFEGGYSLLSKDSGAGRPLGGFAGGIRLNTDKSRVRVDSYNYYSSPYYGGIRRGVFQLDNSILFPLDSNKSLSFSVRLLKNTPRLPYEPGDDYLEKMESQGNNFYEVSYRVRVGAWNISLKPYFYSQSIRMFNTVEPLRSQSFRTRLQMNNYGTTHKFSLDADNGYTLQFIPGSAVRGFISSRVIANYKGPIFGFSTFLQVNSYYLADQPALNLKRPGYVYMTLGPDANFDMLKKKMSASLATRYNYAGYNHNASYTINGNIHWRVKNNWAITADILYGMNRQRSVYDVAVGERVKPDPQDPAAISWYYNHQFRIGIEKGFGRKGNSLDRKLELFFFADLNANGVHDSGEPAAADVLVRIDGTTAITNANGVVKFVGEKDKFYSVSIAGTRNFSLLNPVEITLKRNSRMEIGLVKTAVLTGKLEFVAERYAGNAPPPSGLKVKAVASNGVEQSTLTNEQGEFVFYLPEGSYAVSVETRGLHFKMVLEKQTVKLTPGEKKDIVFKYVYDERKVEVSQF